MVEKNLFGGSIKARVRVALLGFVPIIVLLAGCASAPLNAPLAHYDPTGGYRFHTHNQTNNSGDTLVLLFFSGGGTRAAALSYGVLEQLSRTPIAIHGQQRCLLDEVDLISAVSGGSFTAAYYCLYGDRIFKDFEDCFLKKDVQDALILQMGFPYNWFRLMSPNFSRTDLAAEYYNNHLFARATFADLEKRESSPFLVINATDMGTGGRFSFTQYMFDLLGSDAGSYPIARAVAASSALPIYFAPMTLRNYAGTRGDAQPDWLERLEKTNALSNEQLDLMQRLRTYSDSKQRPFIHLVDGGLADNLGLRSFLEVNMVLSGLANTMKSFQIENINKIVVIVVDASVHRIPQFDQSPKPPGLITVLRTMAGNMVNRSSYETEKEFKANMDEWRQAMIKKDGSGHSTAAPAESDLKYYFVNVNFGILTDPAERDFFENLPTSFKLPAKTVDRVRDVGGRLLLESSEYQRLLHDLNTNAAK
jgi:NTE family protein